MSANAHSLSSSNVSVFHAPCPVSLSRSLRAIILAFASACSRVSTSGRDIDARSAVGEVELIAAGSETGSCFLMVMNAPWEDDVFAQSLPKQATLPSDALPIYCSPGLVQDDDDSNDCGANSQHQKDHFQHRIAALFVGPNYAPQCFLATVPTAAGWRHRRRAAAPPLWRAGRAAMRARRLPRASDLPSRSEARSRLVT